LKSKTALESIKIKRALFITILSTIISLPIIPSAWALDTTECFSVGAITDFELYGNMNFLEDSKEKGMDILVGGGILPNFSWYITAAGASAGKDRELAAPGLGLIWTGLESESFAMDILPGFALDPCKTRDRLTYSDGKAFTYGVNLEFNLMSLKAFQPYIQTGIETSYVKDSDDRYTYACPLALGIMMPVAEKAELLFQFTWKPTDVDTWKDEEREAAIGLNIMILENLELTTQAGYELSEEAAGISLGLIYAL
jgi:hypothetical protein